MLHKWPPPRSNQNFAKELSRQWSEVRSLIECCRLDLNNDNIHDLRVSLRRLLEPLTLLQQTRIHRLAKKNTLQLKPLLKGLNDLRDTQVILIEEDPQIISAPIWGDFLNKIKQHQQVVQNQAQKLLVQFHLEKLEHSIDRLAAKSLSLVDLEPILGQHLQKRFEQVLKKQTKADPKEPKSFHRLRIAFKHFRYSHELLNIVSINNDPSLEPQMNHIQSALGAIQDASVLINRLKQYHPQKPSSELAKLLQQLRLRRQQIISSSLPLLASLSKLNPKYF